jgi:mono/diheme cytochrome c family protein
MKAICIIIAAVLLVAAPISLWCAEDGAALYDSKCSMCHGAKGVNDASSPVPSVKKTTMDVAKLTTYLSKGDKTKTFHADPVGDLNEAQAKAVAEYVKSLK